MMKKGHSGDPKKQNRRFRSRMRELFTSKAFLTAVKIAVVVLLLSATAAAVVWMAPKIPKLRDPAQLKEFKEQLDGFAPYSWLILLGVQILQVVIAVIPGEPVEVLAGVFCGTVGGLLLCLLGILVSSIIIYYLVRWLGRSFIERLFEKEKVRNFKLLNNPRNLELLLFILFFLPGTPKDLLIYMAPLTRVKPIHFFLISTLARIPSVITSTYAGAHLARQEYRSAIIMYAAAAVMSVIGILIYNWISKRKESEREDGLSDGPENK